MDFIAESNDINDYLKADEYINYYEQPIRQKAKELFRSLTEDNDKISKAFEFVRDEISHSWDIGSKIFTKTASEVLMYKEGICITKSLLLAAFLRCAGIPAGLCYQRLTKGETPCTGYIIHGLNAVYLSCEKRWIRLDARGNKQNVNAQFSIYEEKIAFPARSEYEEIDYPTIYAAPHPLVMDALIKNNNCREYNLSEI